MSNCYYCGKKTRSDLATNIEVVGEVMCAGCAKKRGRAPHDLFVRMAAFELEEKISELTEQHTKLMANIDGETPTPVKPAPKPKTPVMDDDRVKNAAAAALAAWDDAPTEPKFKYPTIYKAEDGTEYHLADPDSLVSDIIARFPEDYPFVDHENPHFNKKVYDRWQRLTATDED